MDDLSNDRVRVRRDTIGNWKLGSAASLGGNGSCSSMWSSVGGHGGTHPRDAPLTNGSGRSQSLPRY